MRKNNLLFSLVLIFIISCSNAKEAEGYIYASDTEAFMSNAKIIYDNNGLTIRYPKYNCMNVKYNTENFSPKELPIVCKEVDELLQDKNISFPKKECIDKYRLKGDNISLINIKPPCYGFSKDLNQIIKSKNNNIQQIQFQTKFGLFQGEF